jgi:intracellular septation protein A
MQLLLGLLPLIAFYVGESLYGLQAGLVAAIATSLLDVAYGRLVHGKVNRVVLVSTGLVVLLGGLSLLSDDERFVLWTPVLGDLVFAGVLLASLLAPLSALELALREQDPTVDIDAPMRRFLRGITVRFALNLLLHAGLTAWAVGQSRETWLFVSGPMQYVLMGLQGGLEVVLVRRLPPSARDADTDPL